MVQELAGLLEGRSAVLISYQGLTANVFNGFRAKVAGEGINGSCHVVPNTLLKKAAALDIAAICPLHGPVLTGDLSEYVSKYQVWSSYAPEEAGVLVAFGSLHGNTAKAAKLAADMIKEQGVKVTVVDLARDDMAFALSEAFKYDKLLLACSTYDGNFFPKMEDFLLHLKAKNFCKRKAALIENGSWAPMAAKCMKGYLEQMKEITLCEGTVTIKTTVTEENKAQIRALADELLA